MAALHNKKLLQLLVELSRQLSGFQYSFYDFFSSIKHRVIKSKTYTFETGMAACCGTGSVNGTSCSTNNVCAKPEDYLFFDGKQLTQEGNLQVGHLMGSRSGSGWTEQSEGASFPSFEYYGHVS
uniref:Xylanase inhibitor N-terminal domain-containing protein n=1 Tax=Brassica oleracea TaxID=3712 RepID=A0A3P6BJ55_BRAOL|nr:unnamed protein product [Brassica oleracea]